MGGGVDILSAPEVSSIRNSCVHTLDMAFSKSGKCHGEPLFGEAVSHRMGKTDLLEIASGKKTRPSQ